MSGDVDTKRNELILAVDRATDAWGDAVAERAELRMHAERALAQAQAADARVQVARSAMVQAQSALLSYVEERAGYWSARAGESEGGGRG